MVFSKAEDKSKTSDDFGSYSLAKRLSRGFLIALALFAVRVLAGEIYGVGAYDPATFVAVPLLLAGIAAAASFLPTLRITRIQPAETLRSE
jgi:hypothetical protein